jgi:hypothetical protein
MQKSWRQTPSRQVSRSAQSEDAVQTGRHCSSVWSHPPAKPHLAQTVALRVPVGQNGGRPMPSPSPQPAHATNSEKQAAAIPKVVPNPGPASTRIGYH